MNKVGSLFLVMVGFLAGIAFVYSCGGGGSSSSADVAALEARIEALEYTMSCSYMSTATINGVIGPHFIFSGVNVHIENGSAQTDTNNGLGNLVIGYNEGNVAVDAERTGSYKLIIGPVHRYTSYGGLVAGSWNAVIGQNATVTGGSHNSARGDNSSVSGGYYNSAQGSHSSLSGGTLSSATGDYASVSGGYESRASGLISSVSGGDRRTASGDYDWAAGGLWEDN
jgi:hypothetical protein